MRKLFLIIILLSVTSCMSDPVTLPERNIVENFGYKSNDMALLIADTNFIEAITEMSTQIVLCSVDSLNNVAFHETGTIEFRYDIKIEKIYMDVGNKLNEGDTVPLSTTEGILKGIDFLALVKDSSRAKKLGYAYRTYGDDEYITSSMYDAIPIETGRKYIMYLTDDYLDEYNVYAEIGNEFLYDVTDAVLYKNLDYNKMDISFKELEKQILTDIENRTGRADEIGADAYIEELGELQRANQ